ncbi:CAP domain-containing protein [Streptomyces sp. NBC_01474]|uniref:CAP domain-containing protein n=1 Tax=Streptomyces sp. NBC_01474 TaxID=2903880 RepID=UPI002DDA02F7|nr:CAP domain-containing protein [Streptomyces sp. NBC_01474]WSD94247.1 CAP domain-containing protein [Streptomyces sp. NBC_01474]
MRKHRRKSHHRPIAIAVIAIGAVGVPSAAMACMDTQVDAGGRPSGHWEHVSSHQRWTGSSWGHGPTAGASKSPTATTSAPKTTASPSAPKTTASPSAPKTTASPSAPKTTASPSAPATTASASGDTARVLTLVNNERSKAGCSPLTMNAKLTKAAQDHSKDMASHRNMSHTGSDGSSPGDRITRAGYTWSSYGENVAYGYSTPEKVMAGWMSSPGHKRNILDCSFKEIGIGLAGPNSYWTQDFGTAR